MLGVISIIIGLGMGIISSLTFKYVRFLTVSAITECFILLAFALSSYFISELTVIAGI